VARSCGSAKSSFFVAGDGSVHLQNIPNASIIGQWTNTLPD